MDLLRKLIIERTRHGAGAGGSWTLDVYYYLLGHGARPDDAINAMNAYVDDVIAARKQQRKLIDDGTPVGT